MDNKITKQRINDHLEYDWFKYLIFIVAAVVLWVSIYSFLDKIKDHQQLDFFVTVNVSDEKTKEFEADFIKHLNSLDDDLIKEINFAYHNYDDKSTIYAIMATSLNTMDLVIAQEDAFRYLAATGRLVGFDYNYDFKLGDKKIKGSVFEGFTVTQGDKTASIAPYLKEEDFSSYFVLDQAQKQKLIEEFNEIEVPDELMNIRYGIELNSLGPNIFFFYDQEKETKYYIGVISTNLSKSVGGGNKGVFNAESQDIFNKQAWDAIVYLKNNAAKYSM